MFRKVLIPVATGAEGCGAKARMEGRLTLERWWRCCAGWYGSGMADEGDEDQAA